MPVLQRGSVQFYTAGATDFDWTDKKVCTAYFVKCASCNNVSMHLSFKREEIAEFRGDRWFAFLLGVDLDSAMFYSVPTSLFCAGRENSREVAGVDHGG